MDTIRSSLRGLCGTIPGTLRERSYDFPDAKIYSHAEPGDGTDCPSCKEAGTAKTCPTYRKPVAPAAITLLSKVTVH